MGTESTYFIRGVLLDVFEPVVLSNEHLHLLIDHKLQLFAPHPISQHHDKRYVRRQHLVQSLVVASLKDFQMVLLGIEIGLCWEY